MTARRVVTLPPTAQANAGAFAREAARRGAELLELRNDLLPDGLDVASLAAILPLVVSERGRPLSPAWKACAQLIDRPVEGGDVSGATLISHHASEGLSPEGALALWERVRPAEGAQLKHVEPMEAPASAMRLFETKRLLRQRFGERVTVLATGPCALPFRALLAEQNALDYLAMDAQWSAAPGQRLLDDAFREVRSGREGPRLGILGSGIAHSRSPRIHRQPFDRIDLPPDAPLGDLLDALHGRYRGFSVTSPFKRPAARHIGSELEAVNTLVARKRGWSGANTDVEGAKAVLESLEGPEVIALGDGGVTAALRLATAAAGKSLRVLRREEVADSPLRGSLVWTWPASVEVPPELTFRDARVAIVAYGPPARTIAQEVLRRGGEPLRLGPRWFVAQARAQRAMWEEAR